MGSAQSKRQIAVGKSAPAALPALALRERAELIGDPFSFWVGGVEFQRFRADLRLCNIGLIARFEMWQREDAGLYLMNLASSRQALTGTGAAFSPDVSYSEEQSHVIMQAMANVAICDSCEHERMAPMAWVEFGRRRSLRMAPEVIAIVKKSSNEDAPIAGRQLDMLQRALGAALLLADYTPAHSIREIVEQLNAKGAGVDRQRLTPHIRSAFAKVHR